MRKIFLLLGVFLLVACGGESSTATPEPTETPLPTNTATPTDTPVPTDTPTPLPTDTPTPLPTDTPLPTNTPTPLPTDTPEPSPTPEPVAGPPNVFVEVESQGETVTDNFEWPACEKAIFYWSVAPGSYGSASLILKLHKAGGTDEVNLVNEFQMDVSGNLEGAALQPLAGGEYYFSSENTDEAWTVRGECHDGQPPVASGADLIGEGNQVTGNYELPACQKSVFFWTAEADGGNAALIAKLYKVGSDRSAILANEFEMGVPEGISGSALQPLTGGEYYFSTENTDAGWTIRWECQDDQPPIGTEIDLTGVGNMVTGNYELPVCDKSVFVWSTDPNDSGLASLIMHLFKVGSDQYASLVNAFETDLTEPLTGEALQPLSGGVYYLTTENTNGPWSVRWECRD